MTTKISLRDFLNEMDLSQTGSDNMGQQADMGSKPPRDSSSPDGSYDGHLEEVQNLLDKIGQLVSQHSDTQADSSDKWSHASDMATVVEKLNEVIEMLGGDEGAESSEDSADEPRMTEGKNHLGERTIASFSKWKTACKAKNPNVWFEGDKDICSALVGPKPYVRGETKGLGQWDGVEGTVDK
jgi:hypothetical protein